MIKNRFPKKIKRALQAASTAFNYLGLPCRKYGYYTPSPFAAELKTPQGLYPLGFIKIALDKHIADFEKTANAVSSYNDKFAAMAKGSGKNPFAPRFNQDWFCGLDGAFAYGLVRQIKPKKIIEVGAGFSTRFLAQAIKDENLDTTLYSINPKKLHAAEKIAAEFFECTLDKAPAELLKDLKANDILFVDASHLFMPGADLELLLLDIIPALPKGVYLHFHDIFLPDSYPDDNDWNWWAFNEQALLAVLMQGGGFKPVAPVAYLRKYRPEIINGINAPLHPRGLESSFWLVKE